MGIFINTIVVFVLFHKVWYSSKILGTCVVRMIMNWRKYFTCLIEFLFVYQVACFFYIYRLSHCREIWNTRIVTNQIIRRWFGRAHTLLLFFYHTLYFRRIKVHTFYYHIQNHCHYGYCSYKTYNTHWQFALFCFFITEIQHCQAYCYPYVNTKEGLNFRTVLRKVKERIKRISKESKQW